VPHLFPAAPHQLHDRLLLLRLRCAVLLLQAVVVLESVAPWSVVNSCTVSLLLSVLLVEYDPVIWSPVSVAVLLSEAVVVLESVAP
jgi:hypothetical protein